MPQVLRVVVPRVVVPRVAAPRVAVPRVAALPRPFASATLRYCCRVVQMVLAISLRSRHWLRLITRLSL